MMLQTAHGQAVPSKFLVAYFNTLVNQLFKILPMRENGEETLPVYLESLLRELSGCRDLFPAIHHDAGFMSILSILEYLLRNPDCQIGDVRRTVFQMIAICNQLKERYTEVEP